jgi:hypothetical protein
MYLQDGTRTHFMNFLAREFPAMAPRYATLYRKKYPPDAYRNEVKNMVRMLQDRYGPWAGRTTATTADAREEPAAAAEQVGFRW